MTRVFPMDVETVMRGPNNTLPACQPLITTRREKNMPITKKKKKKKKELPVATRPLLNKVFSSRCIIFSDNLLTIVSLWSKRAYQCDTSMCVSASVEVIQSPSNRTHQTCWKPHTYHSVVWNTIRMKKCGNTWDQTIFKLLQIWPCTAKYFTLIIWLYKWESSHVPRRKLLYTR